MPHLYLYDINKYGLYDRIIDERMYRIAVLNGIQLYVTWLVIFTCITWSNETVKRGLGEPENTAIGFEILIFVILIIYFIMDVYSFKEHLKHTYITYFIVMLSFSAILTKQGMDLTLISQVFSLIIIILSLIAMLFKSLIIVRLHRQTYVDMTNSYGGF